MFSAFRGFCMIRRRRNPPVESSWTDRAYKHYDPERDPEPGDLLPRTLDPRAVRLRMLSGAGPCVVSKEIEDPLYLRLKSPRYWSDTPFAVSGQPITEVALLGVGGYGKTWRITVEGGRSFVLKVDLDDVSESSAGRMCREAEIMAALPSDASADILDVEANSLSMTWLRGGVWAGMRVDGTPNINDLVTATGRGKEDLARNFLLGLIEFVGRLRLAHSIGVVHCDVKFENAIQTGMGWFPIDWGLARFFGDEVGYVGTIGYMAPETAAWTDATSGMDAYACSVMLSMIISGGFSPWSASGTYRILEQQRERDIDPYGLSDRDFNLIYKLLDPDPSTRPNADEVFDLIIARCLQQPALSKRSP